jgi:hypothetical protein
MIVAAARVLPEEEGSVSMRRLVPGAEERAAAPVIGLRAFAT